MQDIKCWKTHGEGTETPQAPGATISQKSDNCIQKGKLPGKSGQQKQKQVLLQNINKLRIKKEPVMKKYQS